MARDIKRLLGEVERRWTSCNVRHGVPASAEQIAEFEARYGVRLPADACAYFRTLNGAEHGRGGPWDDELISFWNLDDVRPLREECSESLGVDADSWFVFADWSIECHYFVTHLSSHPTAE